MQIEIKKLPKSRVEISFELTAEELKPFIEKAVSNASQSVKIEGFRPGKAPRDLIEQKIGQAALYEEAAELAVRKTYVAAVLEKNLNVIGRPEIQILKLAPGNPFNYKAIAAVLPEIKLPDCKIIAAETKSRAKPAEVPEKEINETVEHVRKSRAKHSAVNREAKEGDFCEIDFEARHGGAKIEKGESKNHPLVIGGKEFVPGFEENLVGMKTGEEKTFSVKAPDDYFKKEYAGKVLDFKVKINGVFERILPELNDEFAKTLGKFENLEQLKKSVKEGLLMEKEKKEKDRLRMEILEKIAEKTEMELPDILVESEKEKMTHELEHNVEQFGLTLENYLNQVKKTVDELKKDWQKDAEKRAKAALILREIAAKERLAPTEEEIAEKTKETLAHYHSVQEAGQIDPAAVRDYVEGQLKNEKVFEFLEK